MSKSTSDTPVRKRHRAWGTLTLKLCGVPVSIHPLSWVFLAFLGGAFSTSGVDIVVGLLFVPLGMLCLLVHEMGHALVWRLLTKKRTYIKIYGLGGFTRTSTKPIPRWDEFAVIFAGPLATFLLQILTGFILGYTIADLEAGIFFSLFSPLEMFGLLPESLAMKVNNIQASAESLGGAFVLWFLGNLLIVICFGWTLLNLLPIPPLDGGRLFGILCNNAKASYWVGLILGALLTLIHLVWAIWGDGGWYSILLFGFLTYCCLGALCSEDTDKSEAQSENNTGDSHTRNAQDGEESAEITSSQIKLVKGSELTHIPNFTTIAQRLLFSSFSRLIHLSSYKAWGAASKLEDKFYTDKLVASYDSDASYMEQEDVAKFCYILTVLNASMKTDIKELNGGKLSAEDAETTQQRINEYYAAERSFITIFGEEMLPDSKAETRCE